jgi:hypothetical protein
VDDYISSQASKDPWTSEVVTSLRGPGTNFVLFLLLQSKYFFIYSTAAPQLCENNSNIPRSVLLIKGKQKFKEK